MPTATFSGNGNYYIDVDAAVSSQNVAGNYSTIYWRVIVTKTNGSGFWASVNTGSSGWADSSVGGNPDLWNNGNLAYDFRNGQNTGSWTFAEGHFNVPHDGAGNASYFVNAGMTLASLGSASAGTGTRSLPHISTSTANVPPAPSPVGFGVITQTSIQYYFTHNGDGGSPILEWQALYQEPPVGWQIPYWSNGTTSIGGLKPGTMYNFWSRGRNAVGWGPWSVGSSVRTDSGARVKVNGVWKQAVPYVKVNGVWKLAQPYSKINGVWRKSI